MNAVPLLLFGLAGLVLLSGRTIPLSGPLAVETVRELAGELPGVFGFNVDPAMVVRIAFVESSFVPTAVRLEPRIADASAGLMQTLHGTARWLATDMGYEAFGVPSFNDLLDPARSVYFGGAYLDYLKDFRGRSRGEEFIVRSYNGGPGHTLAGTENYWRKYLAAKGRFG